MSNPPLADEIFPAVYLASFGVEKTTPKVQYHGPGRLDHRLHLFKELLITLVIFVISNVTKLLGFLSVAANDRPILCNDPDRLDIRSPHSEASTTSGRHPASKLSR